MKKNSIIFIMLTIFVAFPKLSAICAQDISDQLIFTKMTFDKKNSQIWFEVMNSTNEIIKLSSFRILGIRTPNILPPDIRNKKGIDLKPSERLIICGDKQSFEDKYGKMFKVIEIKLLQNMEGNGFVAMNFMDGKENTKNIIRFGKSDKSSQIEKKVGDDQIINFDEGKISFAREIKSNGEISSWYLSAPAPGKN